MLKRFIKTFIGVSLVTCFAVAQDKPAAAPQKAAKDQVEYGLMTDLSKENRSVEEAAHPGSVD